MRLTIEQVNGATCIEELSKRFGMPMDEARHEVRRLKIRMPSYPPNRVTPAQIQDLINRNYSVNRICEILRCERAQVPTTAVTANDENIMKLYESGVKAEEIADTVGVSKQTIYNRLRRCEYVPEHLKSQKIRTKQPPGRPKKTALTALVRKLHDAGMSVVEIAAKIKLPYQVVRYHLKKSGEIRRSPQFSHEEIIKLSKQGLSVKEVAATIGCSIPTVTFHRMKAGATIPNEQRGDMLRSQIAELVQQGLSLAKIAAKVNRSVPCVSKHRQILRAQETARQMWR